MIIGGRYQGKRRYAESLYGEFWRVSDLAVSDEISRGLVVNVHLGVRRGLTREFFEERLEVLGECVILCVEIGSGVVPVEKEERFWRDETGRVYQFLAREAYIVDRVFAGCAMRLKPPCDKGGGQLAGGGSIRNPYGE